MHYALHVQLISPADNADDDDDPLPREADDDALPLPPPAAGLGDFGKL
jgi:hypothetical protein